MLDREWLMTFASVGHIPTPNQWQPTGAGVFLQAHNLVWLVTANHVLGQGATHTGVLVAINEQPTVFDLTDILSNSPGADWITDPVLDIAMAPMPTPTGIGLRALTDQQCLPIAEVLPSMPSLTAGCPYGLPGVDPAKPTPIVLDGVVAGIDAASQQLFISTPTFPGSSGGPIYLHRSPSDAAGNLVAGRPTVYLGGIVTEVITLQPTNQPGAAALRLGKGIAIQAVLDLLAGSKARDMAAAIASNPPPSD